MSDIYTTSIFIILSGILNNTGLDNLNVHYTSCYSPRPQICVTREYNETIHPYSYQRYVEKVQNGAPIEVIYSEMITPTVTRIYYVNKDEINEQIYGVRSSNLWDPLQYR